MDSHPRSRVVNSQPAGIGRMVSLGPGCAWNNLGRNVVFADSSLDPLAIFGDTVFPEDDEASQFDLDIHAIVALTGGRTAVLNHLGMVRLFEPPPASGPRAVGPGYEEAGRLDFVDDVERVVPLGGRLVTSRPRGQRLAGVLVTEPVTTSRDRIDADTAHESFGFVSALAAEAAPDGTGWVALGGEGRVRLIETDQGHLGATRWEAPVHFLTGVLASCESSLWAAGSALGGAGLDDYDWEQLGGGGLVQLDLDTGAAVASARFGADLAWGSGSVPMVVADGLPCGVGRRGEVHVLPPGEPVTHRLTGTLAPDRLGIAHAAVVGDQLIFGFNRGGYRLHRVPVDLISRVGRHLPDRRA